MKKALLTILGIAVLCLMATDADAFKNGNGKWVLHYAGVHNSKTNTCGFTVTDCRESPTGDVVTQGAAGPGRYDVYVLAIDVTAIAGTRYGLCCPEGTFWFYGWTKCSDFEIPSGLWPGCGEGNAQTWSTEQAGPHVTLGIIDVYVYAGLAKMCTCEDPRVGFAEWCDGTSPEPICGQHTAATVPSPFGCVGFGQPGYNPCSLVPAEKASWGAVKALYR